MANSNLAAAKEAKNDEFYTEFDEIKAEVENYRDKFQSKVVFCNCDDPFESNFVKYFLTNFNRLGLKELIATGYKTSPIMGKEVAPSKIPYALRVTETKKYLIGTQTDLNFAGAQTLVNTEGNNVMFPLVGNFAHDEDGNPITETFKEKYVDEKTSKTKTRTVKRDVYYEAGDFRSDMCVDLLKECDVVVTNGPFSLFRELIALILSYDKQFLIIGNKNAITYKEFFPLLKDNKVWLGNCVPVSFILPDGTHTKKVSGLTRWFTNIDHAKRHRMIPLDLGYTYEGHEEMYPTYDNYQAINVDKVSEIPCDYKGVMGVPISFMDKYCPEQFCIVAFRKGDDGKDLVFTREREREFNRTFEFLFDGMDGTNYRSQMDEVFRRKESLCADSNTTEDVKMFANHILSHLDLVDTALSGGQSKSKCSSSSTQTEFTSSYSMARSRSNEFSFRDVEPILSEQHQSGWSNQECRRQNQRTNYICENSYYAPINIFFPMRNLCNGNDRPSIKGKLTYARIAIKNLGV